MRRGTIRDRREQALRAGRGSELLADERDWPINPVVICGLLAQTAREGIWRLHGSDDSQEYVEFMEEEMLSSRRLRRRSGDRGLPAPDAEVVHFRTRRTKASDVVWGESMGLRMSARPLHLLHLRGPGSLPAHHRILPPHVVCHACPDWGGAIAAIRSSTAATASGFVVLIKACSSTVCYLAVSLVAPFSLVWSVLR